ncbi:hypothetical protein [Celeribacter halophilus]
MDVASMTFRIARSSDILGRAQATAVLPRPARAVRPMRHEATGTFGRSWL